MKIIVLKWAALLAGMLVCCSVFAQSGAEGNQGKPYEVYCELVGTTSGIFTNKTTVEVDFGQFASFFSNDRQLVDEQGRTITFNSMLDAAN